MKSIAELIEEMDTSAIDELMASPEFTNQGENLIKLIQSNQFNLEPIPNKKD
jgi:hypothetical protein